ncbi:hypothetical protein KXW98_007930 [Aspergillus fumigatus]|nr:hypothetical protein KXX48_004710 [Aspergillus fumigatus]KAH1279514.1 hypothetical protein KXX45_006819 [Aspergillus fumigatus]KAH1288641.1 hypothetical protein KXX30_007490 [Aspergillus fumigatus]KAH1297139.1 hypothetical protein KXX11_007505 [Aspergillus fumigatus]KAH1302967.1 hypothetical protein KXX66_004368 [Aspergillus fumigatus]
MRNKVIARYPYYSGPYFQVYRDSTALDDFDISLRLQMQGMGLDGATAILCHAFSSNLEWASVAEDDEADRVLHLDEQDGEPVQVGLDNL